MNRRISTFNEVDVLKTSISDLLKEFNFSSKDFVSIIPNEKKKSVTINCRTTAARNRIFTALESYTFIEKTGKKTLIIIGAKPIEEIIEEDNLYYLVWKIRLKLRHLQSIIKQRFTSR